MERIECTLQETLDEIGISKNKLAVESKIRPNTIINIANDKAKSVNFDTLVKIISTLSSLAKENGIIRSFGVSDVFVYVEDESPIHPFRQDIT